MLLGGLFSTTRIISNCLGNNNQISPSFSYGLFLVTITFLTLNWFNVPINTINNTIIFIFGLANLVYLSILLKRGKEWRTKLSCHKEIVIISIIFFTVLLYVGAYIEYPSDPVVHLKHINYFLRNNQSSIPTNSLFAEKYSPLYYLSALFFKYSNPLYENRIILDFYAAIMSCVLLFSFYRLYLFVFESKEIIIWGCLFSLLFLGTSIFSYYRYYVLSNALFNYVIYLEALLFIIGFIKEKRATYVLSIFLSILITYINHKQESLFVLVSSIGIIIFLGLFYRYKKHNLKIKVTVLIALLLCLISFMSYFNMSILDLKSCSIFSKHSSIYLTLGTIGFLAIAVIIIYSIFMIPKIVQRGTVSILNSFFVICISPIVFIIFPITYTLFTKVAIPWTIYRLIYTTHYWVFLPFLLSLTIYKIFGNRRLSRIGLRGILFVLVTFSFIPVPVIGGRSYNLFYIPERNQDGKNLSTLFPLLKKRRCQKVITDAYTSQYITVFSIEFHAQQYRYDDNWLLSKAPKVSLTALKSQLAGTRCIVYNKGRKCHSSMGEISGHWKAGICNPSTHYSKTFLESLSKFSNKLLFEENDEFVVYYAAK